mgnify:CR=1 FL=1
MNDTIDDFERFVKNGVYDTNADGRGIDVKIKELKFAYTTLDEKGKEVKHSVTRSKMLADLTSDEYLNSIGLKIEERGNEDTVRYNHLGQLLLRINKIANDNLRLQEKGIYRPLVIRYDLLSEITNMLMPIITNIDLQNKQIALS